MEYDFIVQPGADPSQVRLHISGADAVQLDQKGNLVLSLGGAALIEGQPTVYQEINGLRVPVGVRYTLLGDDQVGFALGSYDSLHPLVIDPVLSYSTYLGGTGTDDAYGIALDSAGSAYVAGGSYGTDFPLAGSSYQGHNAGYADVFVSKLNAAGNALVYSTYLGGSNYDLGEGIAVDSSGNAYVVGETESTNFPTVGALQAHLAGTANVFVSKLNSTGSALVYSTYLGGNSTDVGFGIAVDGSGNANVTGYTTFPTVNAMQAHLAGTQDAFVSKLNAAGSALAYSTYLGGSAIDQGAAIAVDSSGNAYATGVTLSTNFPTLNPIQATHAVGGDAYVSKFNGSSGALVYSTYLGGNSTDDGYGIAVDSSGNAYVVGEAYSSDFPTASPLQAHLAGIGNAFVSKINSAGSALTYSTYLGGNVIDYATGVAVDSSGNAYVTGGTESTNFPTMNAVQASLTSTMNVFVSKLNSAGSALTYSTYLGGSNTDYTGGIAADNAGNAYVGGYTFSYNFPTMNPLQSSYGGVQDAFITKLGAAASSTASSGTIPWHPHYTVSFASGLGAGVDLADGHVDVTADDMHIAGRGPSLDLSHTWDSTQAAVGGATWAGQGWNTDLTQSMRGTPGGTVRYTDATGAVWVFTYSGGAYVTPAGLPWRLTNSGSIFTLTNILTGDVRSFNASGNLTAMSDSYGNSNTVTTPAMPTAETNSGGRFLALAYNSGQFLSDMQSPLWQSTGGTQTVAGTQGQHNRYAYQGEQLTTLTRAALTGDAVIDHFAYTGNQLTSITTPLTMEQTLAVTHTWTLAYDGSGRVSSITSPISGTVGQVGYTPAYTTTFTYNVGNTVVIEGYGTTAALTTTYTLDSQGESTQITDGLSHSNIYTYDADHDVLTAKDGNNNTTINYYKYVGPTGTGGIASTGLVTQTVQPAIHPNYPTGTLTAPTTNYVYDPTSYDLTEQSDNFGAATFYTYNGSHDISSTAVLTGTSVVGPTTYYHWRGQTESYDSYGEPLTLVDGRGLTVPDTTSLTAPTITPNAQAANYTHSWTYFSQGDLKTSTTPPITTTLAGTTTTGSVTTQYTYDGDGNQITMVSANGNTTTYGYDRLGRQNSVKQPPLTLVNPPAGGPTTGQPLTTIMFDGEGNVAMEVDASGGDFYYSYDPLGRLVATQQPLTLRTQSDPRIAAQTAMTIKTYSATNLVSLQDPQGNVTNYTYDAAGRSISAVNAAGQRTTYGYDNADNLTSVVVGNPAGPSSTIAYTYDAVNESTTQAISGPNLSGSLVTTYSYDLHGHLVRQQDPNNDTTFAGYDLADELVSQELDPSAPNTPTGAHRETFTYDAAGNRNGSTDFRGGATQMTLDGDDRQTGQLDSFGGASPISTTAGFDPDGNLIAQAQSIAGNTHTFGATLNPADWPQQATNDGLTSNTTGAGVGDVLAQTIQNQAGTVTYNIDQAGRDNQIGVLSMGSSTPLTTTYAFNNNEQMTGEALPNNVEQDTQFDGANRLTQVTALNTVNHTLLNNIYQYGYDPLGLTSAITTTVQGSPTSQTLTHDAAGRLTAVSGTAPTGSWMYDGRGNLQSATSNATTTSYSYIAGNPEEVASTSISAQPTTYYAYDGNGDTTGITNTGTLNRQLSYDAQTRLTQVTLGSPITETVVITYTAFGQRANYVVTPAGAGQPSLSESFRYQGDQLSQVAFTGTNITTPYTDTYVYSQDGTPLELLRQQGATVTPYWYVMDGQSNVIALTDGGGNVVDSYTYDQWGKPVSVSESVPQQLRYAGYWYDNELGWYWLNVRAYDPVLERFLQPDPSELQGLFSYVYAGDNPSDLGDSTGLIATPPQSGSLLTANGNFENNVAVGSTQWNYELSHGAKVYGGLVGANGRALTPGICGGMVAVCSVNLRAFRANSGPITAIEPEPPEPPGESPGADFDYNLRLLGRLTEEGIISPQAYTGISHDLTNPASAEFYAQAKFALRLAQSGVPIEDYSARFFRLNPNTGALTRVGEIDAVVPNVQIEFTDQGDFDGKIRQWRKAEANAALMNPTGKARVVFVEGASENSLANVRREGLVAFNNYEDLLKFLFAHMK